MLRNGHSGLAMPELPDITVYIEALERYRGERIQRLRIASPNLLRTYEPPYQAVEGKRVTSFSRMGKRIVWGLEDGLFIVLHLMIAGRLKYSDTQGKPIPGKVGLAAWDFADSTVVLVEFGTRKRAGLWVVEGTEALKAHDPGGLELFESTLEQFAEAIRRDNRTLKRALTDPSIISGIGNAYSDEILWEAQLSPVARTASLSSDEVARLYEAARSCLSYWIDQLRSTSWPEATAFRSGMAVHGKYSHPCTRCGAQIQRISYAENEVNYCPGCQTGGRVLADRSLSRILKGDWPRTVEELEEMRLRR